MGTILGFWVLVFPGLFLYTAWYVSIPVAVVERRQKPGTAALYRSGDLTGGERWAILGSGIVLHGVRFVVWMVLAFVVSRIVWEIGRGPDWDWNRAVEVLVIHGINVLLIPPLAVAPAVAYYLLRTNREGLDAHRLSKIFG